VERPAAPAHSCCISAGIDLALALLEENHGRNLALEVARYLVLFLKRSSGQAQFSTQLRAQFSVIPAIQRVQLWCQENLSADLRVGAPAQRAAMSERSFIRAFRDDTGQAPAEFVASVRLQAACRLLEDTALAPKAVARRCGLGSPAALRRVFMRHLGVSPTQYRNKILRVECEMAGVGGLKATLEFMPMWAPRCPAADYTRPGPRSEPSSPALLKRPFAIRAVILSHVQPGLDLLTAPPEVAGVPPR
jgi:AraC-like DNA-binding protein